MVNNVFCFLQNRIKVCFLSQAEQKIKFGHSKSSIYTGSSTNPKTTRKYSYLNFCSEQVFFLIDIDSLQSNLRFKSVLIISSNLTLMNLRSAGESLNSSCKTVAAASSPFKCNVGFAD